MHEAKSQLSRLVRLVQAGEEVVIATAGKPVARLVRYEVLPSPREPGALRGQIVISPDFDELPPEIAEAFGVE